MGKRTIIGGLPYKTVRLKYTQPEHTLWLMRSITESAANEWGFGACKDHKMDVERMFALSGLHIIRSISKDIIRN